MDTRLKDIAEECGMETDVTIEALEHAIRGLPSHQRHEVLLFSQFLAYRDAAEDPHLWRAVEAHQAYRATHPDEQPDVYDTPEAFLHATDDL